MPRTCPAFAPHLPRICPALALPCAVAIVAAIVIDSSPITLVKKFPRRVSLNILRGFALRGCADRRRGIGGGSLPLPDGVAGLRGIVGGYRLMEGRTVAATGNGCGGGSAWHRRRLLPCAGRRCASAWHRRRLCASRMRRQARGIVGGSCLVPDGVARSRLCYL